MSIVSSDRMEQNATLVRRCESEIFNAYRTFQGAGTMDPDLFDRVATAFNQFEHVDREIRLASSSDAHLQNFETVKKCFDEMFEACKFLTRYDLQVIGSFFTRSPEQYYISSNNEKYLMPDHSPLFRQMSVLSLKTYSGHGMSRHLELPHPKMHTKWVCDLLYMRKRPDQIAFERAQKNRGVSRPWYSRIKTCLCPGYDEETVQEVIEQQETVLTSLDRELKRHTTSWGYSYSQLCIGVQFLEFGLPLENVETMHAVILFYKKCDANPQRIEEANVTPSFPTTLPMSQIEQETPVELVQQERSLRVQETVFQKLIARIRYLCSCICYALHYCIMQLRFVGTWMFYDGRKSRLS